jgi:hypothetical protein
MYRYLMLGAFVGMMATAGLAYAEDADDTMDSKGSSCQETGDGNVNCAGPGSLACQTVNGKTTCSSSSSTDGRQRSEQRVQTGGDPAEHGVTKHGKNVTVQRPDGSTVEINKGNVEIRK